LKGGGGFRVIAEIRGETWQVDEKSNFKRLARAGSKTSVRGAGNKKDAASPSNAAADSGTPPPYLAPNSALPGPRKGGIFSQAAAAGGGTSGGDSRVPMAVLAGDHIAPLVEVPPLEVPTLTRVLNPKVNTVKPEDEARAKLAKCFSKQLFGTKMCATLFKELDSQCAVKDGDGIPVMCAEYKRVVAEIHLDDCDGEEATWGKCELRAQQIRKLCENPLRQGSSECRALTKYLARTPTGKPNAPKVSRNVAQASPSWADLTSILLLKNVQTLPPSLRKILTLRPVSYELKDGRRADIGFVAEEAEAVDTVLVNYTPDNQIQGVRYPQLATLLTSGLQELYGMCKSDTDLNKELIRKVISLQDENALLKEKLQKQAHDLLIIKEKLGIK
jgi:hypothetical protein